MPTFRVDKTKNYTTMSNYHFRDKRLSLKAKGLLSFMLSLPEEWDYTQKGLATTCKDGVDAISTAIKELADAGYLTRQRVRDEHGRVKDIEYTIYESPIEPAPKESRDKKLSDDPDQQKIGQDTAQSDVPEKNGADKSESPQTPVNTGISTYTGKSRLGEFEAVEHGDDPPKRDFPRQENPRQEKPVLVHKELLLNTNKTNTNSICISSYPIGTEDKGARTREPMRSDAQERYREIIHENIDYDYLTEPPHNIDRNMLDEFVGVIVDTLCRCDQHKYIRVAKTNFTSEQVRERLLSLDIWHIVYVIECYEKSTTDKHDIGQYILTALWNAPNTINSYYTSRVNHDMNRCEEQAGQGWHTYSDFIGETRAST